MKNIDVNYELGEVESDGQITDSAYQSHDWENDPVWDLLQQGEPIHASAGFVDRVVHAIQAEGSTDASFWSGGRKYVAALLAAAACLAAFLMIPNQSDRGVRPIATDGKNQVHEVVETFADLQAETDQEMLLAAVDHLHDFSDTELVTLIGL